MLPAEPTFRTSLLDLLRIVFQRKWSIIVIILTTLLAALGYRLLIRGETYELEGRVLVKIGREQAPPTMLFGDRPMVIGYREQDVNSEIALMTSRDVLEDVVDKLKLDQPSVEEPPAALIARIRFEAKRLVRQIKSFQKETMIWAGLAERLSPREEAIFLLSKSLRVEPMTDSNIVLVKQATPRRQGSSVVLNTLLDTYIAFRIEAFRDPTAVEFLTAQAAQSAARLEEAEKLLHDFEIDHEIVQLEQQFSELIKETEAAASRMVEAEIAAADAQRKLEHFLAVTQSKKNDIAQVGEFAERPFPETLQKQLTEVEMERIRLALSEAASGRLTENNRRQFEALIELLTSHLQVVSDERKAEVQLRRDSLQVLRRRQEDLHAARARWRELDRDVRLREESHALFAKKLEDAKATASLDEARVGNVAIVERVHDPIIPSGPRMSLFLAVALALGIIASISWVSVLEFFDHRVHSEGDLHRHLQAPVFAVVPYEAGLRR